MRFEAYIGARCKCYHLHRYGALFNALISKMEADACAITCVVTAHFFKGSLQQERGGTRLARKKNGRLSAAILNS